MVISLNRRKYNNFGFQGINQECWSLNLAWKLYCTSWRSLNITKTKVRNMHTPYLALIVVKVVSWFNLVCQLKTITFGGVKITTIDVHWMCTTLHSKFIFLVCFSSLNQLSCSQNRRFQNNYNGLALHVHYITVKNSYF